MSKHSVILGGGLAGLSCGYELAKEGQRVTVLEREAHVGGMASSFIEDGDEYWCHDYGPHRFHSRDQALLDHIKAILGDNIVTAQRQSRIVLFNRFFDYPLVASNVLRNMPPYLLAKSMLDYLWVRFLDVTRLKKFDDLSFESWVTRRFGYTLYSVFFGQYTEKAWGMSPSEISADWASQRISLLNLWDTIKKTLFRPKTGEGPRTLVTSFIYPKYGGIGELCRGYVRRIEDSGSGSKVLTDAPAIRVHRDGDRIVGIEYGKQHRELLTADNYVSTMPITSLIRILAPKAPDHVIEAARSLKFISIVFVYLKLDRPSVSPDSWIYLPEKHLTVHRIAEFKNFSPHCAPKDKTMVCAEITCRRGDGIWRASDQELQGLAEKDLVSVGLIDKGQILSSFTRRIPYAYPVYDLQYRKHIDPVIDYAKTLVNLITTGRQGNFRYNNMDQSIEMGRKVGKRLATGMITDHDSVATGKEYFG